MASRNDDVPWLGKDLIASKLTPHGEHSRGFMVYAVDENGSEVVKVAVAAARNGS
jgi:hypothetical protein